MFERFYWHIYYTFVASFQFVLLLVMICLKKLSIKSAEHSVIRKIYEDSFPVNERREYDKILRLIGDNDAYMMEAVYDDDVVVGLISSWNLRGWRYVEHFAIDATQRGRGVGLRVLKLFIERSLSPIVLEVEPPIDELSKRRVAFYNSVGFVLHDTHRYIQPPYGEGLDAVALKLMTYGASNEINLDNITAMLHTQVYGVCTGKM